MTFKLSVIITNFVVVLSVGIKRVDCILLHTLTFEQTQNRVAPVYNDDFVLYVSFNTTSLSHIETIIKGSVE